MTIASAPLPAVNAAHEARPMNGGIFQPSTWIGRSFRGAVTLKTPLFAAPLRPVIASIRSEEKPRSAPRAPLTEAATAAQIETNHIRANVFFGDITARML